MMYDPDNTKTSLVARTLWRIESDPARAPSLTALADAEDVSQFQLARAFSLVTGQSPIAYVRARRLTEAARQLRHTEDSVLNIALDAGYESHEGFARAFRNLFGCAPSAARNALPHPLQEPFQMTQDTISIPPAKIASYPGLRVVGRARRFTVDDRPRVPAFWQETIEEIGQFMFGNETFGVSYDFDENETMTYMVGFADDGRTDTTELDHVLLAAGRYAVFEHEDHIASIGQTWAAIFDGGLDKAGVTLADGPEFERYSPEFSPDKPGGVSIWIPVVS